jgi:hypothetical protein
LGRINPTHLIVNDLFISEMAFGCKPGDDIESMP